MPSYQDILGAMTNQWKRIPIRPLAYGEATGHMHAVCPEDEDRVEMYEMEGGRLALVVTDGKVRIVHGTDPSNVAPVQPGEDRHGPLLLDREHPTQQRQGDVLVTPRADVPGAWDITIQVEEGPDEAIRKVID